MSDPTQTWWSLLCAVAVLNLLGWLVSASLMGRGAARLHPVSRAAARLQALLSAGYVLGCAYRSAFPVFDIRRLCLVDSWLSSVIVGRSVATVAELCFAAQWALLLRGVARSADSAAAAALSRLVVPMIVVAEMCSWYAVLTTSNIGHVFEESIWGLCAVLLVASFAALLPRCERRLRPLLAAACVFGVGYAAYMFGVDVPMYWARWVQDSARGQPVLDIAQGLADASGRWVVSTNWADWKTEVVWMSLYFSVAVWLSIGMIHVPAWLVAHRDPPQPAAQRRPATLGWQRARP